MPGSAKCIQIIAQFSKICCKSRLVKRRESTCTCSVKTHFQLKLLKRKITAPGSFGLSLRCRKVRPGPSTLGRRFSLQAGHKQVGSVPGTQVSVTGGEINLPAFLAAGGQHKHINLSSQKQFRSQQLFVFFHPVFELAKSQRPGFDQMALLQLLKVQFTKVLVES